MSNITQRKTGLSDEVQLKDDTGTDLFTEIDVNIESASHDVSLPSDLIGTVGDNVGYVARQDGVVEVNGDLSLRAIDFKPLQLLGSYSESETDGDGTTEWSISSQASLPEWEFHQQITDSKTMVLSGYDDSGAEPVVSPGFEFEEITISIERDQPVTISFTGLGMYAEVQENSIDTNYSSLNPENWLDAHFEIDGTAVGSVESAEITITRGATALRGIEQRDPAYRRLPTQIVPGQREVDISVTVEITDGVAWEKVFDQDTYPVRPAASSSEHTTTVVLGDRDSSGDTNNTEAGELQVSGVSFNNASGELTDDPDVRTVDLSGNGRDWSVEGEVV